METNIKKKVERCLGAGEDFVEISKVIYHDEMTPLCTLLNFPMMNPYITSLYYLSNLKLAH